jgi:hypothetical protein
MRLPSASEDASPLLPTQSLKNDILLELQTILDSSAFRSSLRAREFLAYVVHEALDGNSEALKERSIGIDLYHRSPNYVTGDDPVVRVKAGEVRRRLIRYYAENPFPGLRIEIPLGSYVPQFVEQSQPTAETELLEPQEIETVVEPVEKDKAPLPVSPQAPAHARRRPFANLGILAVVALVVAYLALRPRSFLLQFWNPLFTAHTPVLVCLPSPVGYALSSDVAQRGTQPKADASESQLASNAVPITLDPEANVKGREITPLIEYYVNKDDAYVLAEVSKVLAHLGQDDQFRIGKELTFADLRSSPSVLIGAYDNPWTIKMSSDLPYLFKQDGNLPVIEDKANPARTWRPEPQGRFGSSDFAVVARVLNSKSGQPMVIIAGTGMAGTEAAGRILCDETALREATAGLPKDWVKRNVEMVLETDQVDGSSSRSRVVAFSVW